MRILAPGAVNIIQPYAGGQPRLYPNLNPAAALPVDRDQVFRLNSFFDNYRLHRGKELGQYVPNSKYVFVKMASGETLLHPRFRHPALAEGRPVLYAGEARFDNGKLLWWSNASGNYRPDPSHAVQAGFPMDQFLTYEKVLQGIPPEAGSQKVEERGSRPALQPKIAPGRFAAERRVAFK